MVDGRRAAHPLLHIGEHEDNPRSAEPLEALAGGKGRFPAQIVLARLLAQGDDVVTLPDMRNAVRLDERAAAIAVTLAPDEAAALTARIPAGAAAGPRYPVGGMDAVQH